MFRNFLKDKFIFGLAATLSLVYLTGAAQAQSSAGSLDATFGNNGKVIANLGNSDNVAGAVAVQPDGKVIVVGLSGTIDTAGKTPGSSDFVVLRYNANGTPDNTFDGDGRVVTSFGNGEDGAGAVLIQPDGKILVAGSINTSTPAGQIALARYNSDGSLDATFDVDGKVTTDVAEMQNVDERADAMILQPDGKILVVVSSVNANFLDDDVFVVRYNADGSRDFSFAGDGITTLPWIIAGGTVQALTGSDIALQSDGKIIVAGTLSTADTSDFFLWRLNAEGSNDETFRGNLSVRAATATASFTASDRAISLFIQPDGKIFLAGTSFNLTQFKDDFAFARFNANGTLDNTFDGDGKKITSYNDPAFTIPFKFRLQPNGKIVSVGTLATGASITDARFAVTRFNADGNLDATFDGDGKVVTDFGVGLDAALAVAIQPDGKVIAAGSAETAAASDNFDLAIARYIGDTVAAPNETEFDFDGDGKSDIAVFRPAAQSQWYFLRSGSGDAFAATQWGGATDKPVPADFDGDGKTDVAVWREAPALGQDSLFYILQSTNNTLRAEVFGQTGDTPIVVNDWDGDGKADPAVYRNGATAGAQSVFYYRPSTQPAVGFVTVPWGVSADLPVRGDFDGDNKADAAVYRPSDNRWYVLQSSNNQLTVKQWGLPTDKRVPADYDGDGKTDLAVVRGGLWNILQSSDNQPRYVNWGLETDKLVPADYDGDGKTDVAVNRNGNWYSLNSSNGQTRTNFFGTETDIPAQTTRFSD